MFGAISNIFNPVNLVAASLMGPGALMMASVGRELMSTIARDVMDSLDLPDFAQTIVASQLGLMGGGLFGAANSFQDAVDQLADDLVATVSERAFMQTTAQLTAEVMTDVANNMLDETRREVRTQSNDDTETGGKGWIRAMAEKFGEKLNDAWAEAEGLADNINKSDPKTTADYQGAIKEFGFMMEAFMTAIKTAGDAANTGSRKG